MNKKKVFVLLPDGVGLRNFAFTKFPVFGNKEGFEIVYWNNTVKDLEEIGLCELKIKDAKLHPFTDILKNAKIHISLNQFIKKTNDKTYDTYRFPFNNKTLKSKIKTICTKVLIKYYNSQKGIEKLSRKINSKERQTAFYRSCYEALKKEKPDFVFCTNQRPSLAIAPLLAAQDLGIPTSTFIFSWDNLPKATMVVDTDYYFVWSDYMKDELLFYYPHISENQVIVTGTPQFEPHFNDKLFVERTTFCKQFNLDENKMYICFSGDDITTSPDDEQYLEAIAEAVTTLNSKGANLGIIFRRCPVDFSDRYDYALRKYDDVITSIDPLWSQDGDSWNTVMPTKEDLALLVNVINTCEMVINVASSMVFDFGVLKKPCLYINYNCEIKRRPTWKPETVYNFIHFRSMPNEKSVHWLTNKDEIVNKIESALKKPTQTLKYVENWFETINCHPPQNASERIWEAIKSNI
jgi:hypothetical protein